ncbi:sugar-binding transcriptional regulator [Amaricoccus tamworthensis]|uniref:sugar-binding transcriptional regulator n=1 Tax=Amaricoccus tamworthensis TaxID=57002 RepID=UPI003C79BA23
MAISTRRRSVGAFGGDRIIIEAAWLYYHEGMNQNAIAERLDVSRATVVNYLSDAREKGFVRITLANRVFTSHELSLEIKQRFGLEAVYVVADDASAEGSLTRVARGAAEWLPDLLAPGDRLGVAWGQTVFEIAEAMNPTRTTDVVVHQLVGSVSSPYGFTAEVCSAHLADRLGARCVNLHAPAVISTAELANRLREEPIIQQQFAALSQCNKAIFAAGSCAPDSHVVLSGISTLPEFETYVKDGAAGVLCGRFIDQSGREVRGPLDGRIMGVELDLLTGLDMGILVSVGEDKVRPMLSAIRGGYVTHVVTSESTAAAILALDDG